MSDNNLSETVLLSLGEIKGLLTGALERTTILEQKVAVLEKRVWYISGGVALVAWLAERFLNT